MAAAKRTVAERGKRAFFWLGFSVIFSLAPLFVNFVLVRSEHHGWNRDYAAQLYDHGELLLIAVALCADGLGRLLNHKGAGPSFFAVFFTILVAVLLGASTVEFGLIAKDLHLNQPADGFIINDSRTFFLCAVGACLGVVLAEE